MQLLDQLKRSSFIHHTHGTSGGLEAAGSGKNVDKDKLKEEEIVIFGVVKHTCKSSYSSNERLVRSHKRDNNGVRSVRKCTAAEATAAHFIKCSGRRLQRESRPRALECPRLSVR